MARRLFLMVVETPPSENKSPRISFSISSELTSCSGHLEIRVIMRERAATLTLSPSSPIPEASE